MPKATTLKRFRVIFKNEKTTTNNNNNIGCCISTFTIFCSLNKPLIHFFPDNSQAEPKLQILQVGKTGVILCHSDRPVVWGFNGGNVPRDKNIIVFERAIYFFNVDKFMEGVYICYGKRYTIYTWSMEETLFLAKSILLVKTSSTRIGLQLYIAILYVSMCIYLCMNVVLL